MFTTVAFSESIDPAGAFAKIAGVPDQHVKVSGDQITIPQFNRLLGAAAFPGTTGVEARLVSPSLRRLNPYYIYPITKALLPSGEHKDVVTPSQSYLLDTDEGLEAEIKSDPAAAEQESIVVWLADSEITPVKGSIVTVNFSFTMALVAGAWAFSEIDFVDELPVGNYSIVGMAVNVLTGVCGRIVPVGGNHRPGVLCSPGADFGSRLHMRYGEMGVFSTFNTQQPPGIEVLGSEAAASTTYEGYFDLIRQ